MTFDRQRICAPWREPCDAGSKDIGDESPVWQAMQGSANAEVPASAEQLSSPSVETGGAVGLSDRALSGRKRGERERRSRRRSLRELFRNAPGRKPRTRSGTAKADRSPVGRARFTDEGMRGAKRRFPPMRCSSELGRDNEEPPGDATSKHAENSSPVASPVVFDPKS